MLSLYIKLADISVVHIYNITFPFILCIIKHESSCSRTEREREGGNRQRVKVIKWSQGTDRERERENVVGLQKHCGGQEKRLRERRLSKEKERVTSWQFIIRNVQLCCSGD